MFNELDDASMEKVEREKVVRAPFPWPGGKTKSLKNILPHLPYRTSYIEPFGGSGAVLLARQPSDLEVFNDRYSGITVFYRCLRDSQKSRDLVNRLSAILHSREEFVWCKETWENCDDEVERAARWYYTIMFSFGSIGRNFGRGTGDNAQLAQKTANHVLEFDQLHARLRQVVIENQDYKNILHDFDNPDAVFYLDPPYYKVYKGTYKCEIPDEEHKVMLNHIMEMQGFVALSGYDNELYNKYDWDATYQWEAGVAIKPMAFHDSNNKETETQQRETTTETLWIKEAR